MTKYIALILLVALRIAFQPSPVKNAPAPFSTLSPVAKAPATLRGIIKGRKQPAAPQPRQKTLQGASAAAGRRIQSDI